MPNRTVVLINSNEMRPPVAPLALDYIGDHVAAAGFDVRLVDLSFAEDPAREITRTLADISPIAVGITFRNTDDCFWPSGDWFVPRLKELTDLVTSATDSPIVLGGCGFSLFPAQILDQCGTDLAVVGDGEQTFLQLIQHLEAGTDYCDVPGLAYRNDAGNISVNPQHYPSDLNLPTARSLVDNARYLREGAMGNIETKRGCPNRCIYCADPVAKGAATRCRPPAEVADEIESLLAQSVDVLHLCDAEFNISPNHAMNICREIIARGLGDRIRWYCYATVRPFPSELASAMRRAGCVGVNFGVDSGCDRMLTTLGRRYRRDDIRQATVDCRREGLAVMLDLLIGAPGETPDSVKETIDFIKDVDPHRAGAAMGVRVYPQTSFAEMIKCQGPLETNPSLHGCVTDNDDLLRPVFYIDRRLGDRPADLIADLIAGDQRFFQPANPDHADDYNYNDNTILENAIAAGHRGAFWDILRRIDDADA